MPGIFNTKQLPNERTALLLPRSAADRPSLIPTASASRSASPSADEYRASTIKSLEEIIESIALKKDELKALKTTTSQVHATLVKLINAYEVLATYAEDRDYKLSRKIIILDLKKELIALYKTAVTEKNCEVLLRERSLKLDFKIGVLAQCMTVSTSCLRREADDAFKLDVLTKLIDATNKESLTIPLEIDLLIAGFTEGINKEIAELSGVLGGLKAKLDELKTSVDCESAAKISYR